MRAKLSLCLYMLLVEVVACYLVVFPVYAFQVSQSTHGLGAHAQCVGRGCRCSRPRVRRSWLAVASAASAGGSSLAIRLVAGLGWAGLGVAAGLLLYQAYYSSQDLAAVKAGATPAGTWTVPGWDTSGTTNIAVAACPGGAGCTGAFDQIMTHTKTNGSATLNCPNTWTTMGAVTAGPTTTTITCGHSAGNPASLATPVPGPVPTAQQINDWLATLPANDPLSIPSHTAVAGVGAQPQSADQVVNQPVDATSVTTQVVPATQVGVADVVVNPNAPPPAGPLPVQNGTQNTTTTTTTTTTTNPNGSTTTTTTQTDTAPVQCNAGNHEQRTFGGILQDHMDLWKGSGLLSALNLLKTLTWPTTIPTYSLQSNLLGTFTLDFSAWSGMLTALRSIIIAIAGFVAYRIVFVGAR